MCLDLGSFMRLEIIAPLRVRAQCGLEHGRRDDAFVTGWGSCREQREYLWIWL
jgi:hypothetical protein